MSAIIIFVSFSILNVSLFPCDASNVDVPTKEIRLKQLVSCNVKIHLHETGCLKLIFPVYAHTTSFISGKMNIY